MKTQELLNTAESDLAPALKSMKIKELERHGKKILARLGQNNFDGVMANLIKLIQTLENDEESRYQKVQKAIREWLPGNDAKNDEAEGIIERATIVLVVLITKKFTKIHASK